MLKAIKCIRFPISLYRKVTRCYRTFIYCTFNAMINCIDYSKLQVLGCQHILIESQRDFFSTCDPNNKLELHTQYE